MFLGRFLRQLLSILSCPFLSVLSVILTPSDTPGPMIGLEHLLLCLEGGEYIWGPGQLIGSWAQNLPGGKRDNYVRNWSLEQHREIGGTKKHSKTQNFLNVKTAKPYFFKNMLSYWIFISFLCLLIFTKSPKLWGMNINDEHTSIRDLWGKLWFAWHTPSFIILIPGCLCVEKQLFQQLRLVVPTIILKNLVARFADGDLILSMSNSISKVFLIPKFLEKLKKL